MKKEFLCNQIKGEPHHRCCYLNCDKKGDLIWNTDTAHGYFCTEHFMLMLKKAKKEAGLR